MPPPRSRTSGVCAKVVEVCVAHVLDVDFASHVYFPDALEKHEKRQPRDEMYRPIRMCGVRRKRLDDAWQYVSSVCVRVNVS